MVSELPLEFPIIKIEKRGFEKRGESKRDKIKRRSKKDSTPSTTGFCHNSITVVILNNGDGTLKEKEITIKIFQNGVFHMTGVLDELYDTSSVRILMDTLWKYWRWVPTNVWRSVGSMAARRVVSICY
jgi:hypothetical protein